jgi:hypothetical protein
MREFRVTARRGFYRGEQLVAEGEQLRLPAAEAHSLVIEGAVELFHAADANEIREIVNAQTMLEIGRATRGGRTFATNWH